MSASFRFYNGIRFSDLSWILKNPELQNTLAARGLVYMTAFERDGFTYRGDVIARSASAARQIARSRGLGERIVLRITRIGIGAKAGEVMGGEPLSRRGRGPRKFEHGPFGRVALARSRTAPPGAKPELDDAGRFDPRAPMCDGILYSDLWLISEEFQNVLATRGLVYETEIDTPEGDPICGDVIAKSWRAAEEIAFGRGLGERVVGRISAIGIWRDPGRPGRAPIG